MGRMLSRVYVIEGTLAAETPVHIGGAENDLIADMPLARDGAGHFYLPATSLAGPIRRWWQRCNFEEDVVFGRTAAGSSEGSGGHASYVIVDDAPVTSQPASETRDGVGIDRETGCAADGIKYDREVLPIGTRFAFRMELQVPDAARMNAFIESRRQKGTASGKDLSLMIDDDQIEPRIGALILALEAGRIRFGAAKTRGLGRLTLQKTKAFRQDLGTRSGLLDRLGQTPKDIHAELVAKAVDTPDEVEITITWRPILPVMNKSAAEGVSVDALPLVTIVGDKLQPVITGASLKGVLRSHAERICRTLAGAVPKLEAAHEERKPSQQFLDDLVEPELELSCALFGTRGISKNDDELYKKRKVVPGLGALSIDDCVVADPIDREVWNKILTVSPADNNDHKTVAVRDYLDRKKVWQDYRPATHVAIDRWTGGAAEGLLFSTLEPSTNGPPREFRMTLDLQRIARPLGQAGTLHSGADDHQFQCATVALLIVLLREMVHGRVPIGFGSTRGFGSIAIDEIKITVPPAARRALQSNPTEPSLLPETTVLSFARDAAIPHDAFARFEALQTAWQAYWKPDQGKAA